MAVIRLRKAPPRGPTRGCRSGRGRPSRGEPVLRRRAQPRVRKQERIRCGVEGSGCTQHARPRRARTGPLQNVDHRPRDRHPVPVVHVGRLRPGREPLQDRAVERDRRVLAPHGVVRVLDEGDRTGAAGEVGRVRAGDCHDGGLDRDRGEVQLRLPGELLGRDDRLDEELRRREQHQGVRAGRLQPRHLRDDVRGRQLVGLRGDDPRPLAGERARQAARHVLAELGVLVEDADLRARPRANEIAADDRALALVARQEADRPRVARRASAEGLGAVAGEQVRHPLRVQVVADREVVGGADRVEDREHAVLLDEAPCLLDGLRGVVCVVVEAVLDLPAVHAAARVDVVEVRPGARADAAERGCFAGERHRSADQDRRLRDARLCHARRAGRGARGERDDRDGEQAPHPEIGVASSGIRTLPRVTRSRAVDGNGRSR